MNLPVHGQIFDTWVVNRRLLTIGVGRLRQVVGERLGTPDIVPRQQVVLLLGKSELVVRCILGSHDAFNLYQ